MKKILLTLALIGLLIPSVSFGATTSTTFIYTGATSTWTVPAGITRLTITARGAAGGEASNYSRTVGYGQVATGTISVSPGQTYYFCVGGVGGKGTTGSSGGVGGFCGGGSGSNSPGNSGGGGGGMTWFSSSTSFSTSSVIIVAGAGGGATTASNGGNGGHPSGESTSYNCSSVGGGTQTAGGVSSGCTFPGGNGSAGIGGNGGGDYQNGNSCGGGGSGFFGGAGGGKNSGTDGASGAGGSSYFLPTMTATSTSIFSTATSGILMIFGDSGVSSGPIRRIRGIGVSH